MTESVTIGVINYNGEKLLPACLSAIENLDYPHREVLLIDNRSTDRSVQLARKDFPAVRILEMPANRGPNPARNAALLHARTEYVLLVDNDILVTEGALTEIMDIVRRVPDVALITPRIRLYHHPEEVQYEGRHVHYIGAMTSREYPSAGAGGEAFPVEVLSGAILLVNRKKAVDIGLFDEDYFFGWEDGDFTTRMRISGFRCLRATRAVVYHNTGRRGLAYAYYQVRNRWFFMLKVYSLRTLLVISPALLFYECIIAALMAVKGKFWQYVKANFSVMRNLRKIIGKRRQVQSLRRIGDRDLLTSGRIIISDEVADKRYLQLGNRIMNAVLDAYWKMVYGII